MSNKGLPLSCFYCPFSFWQFNTVSVAQIWLSRSHCTLFLLFRHFALRSYLFFLFWKIPFSYWHSFIIFRCQLSSVCWCNKHHTWLHFYACRLPHAPTRCRQQRGWERSSILFLIKCVLLFAFLWRCVCSASVRECVLWRLEHFACVLLRSTPTSLLGGWLRFGFDTR